MSTFRRIELLFISLTLIGFVIYERLVSTGMSHDDASAKGLFIAAAMVAGVGIYAGPVRRMMRDESK